MSYHPPKPSTMPEEPVMPSASTPSGVVERPGPTVEDLRFVNELSAAGLLDDLHGEELARITRTITEVDDPGKRQLDLLLAYYDVGRDLNASEARRRKDRFYMLANEDVVSAPNIVARLAQLNPELGDDVILERLGGEDGPLVLRAGEHVVGVVDEYEETLETDEIDLRGLEAETITLRGIVQAVNILLGRAGAAHRMVPLLGDDAREAYVAATRASIIELYRAGFLDFEDRHELEEHCSF
jgi:hypothetical protein